MYKIILWDLDSTLIDFRPAERNAIKNLFKKFNLGACTDEMIDRYDVINSHFWRRFEKGKIDKRRGLVRRFRKFFAEYNIDVRIAEEFNTAYQLELGETIVYLDDSYNLLKKLKKKGYKQYLITNGTIAAQTKKLKNSKFDKILDGIFISEIVGYEKPQIEFFDSVLKKLKIKDKSKLLVVGDSLTSDMKGGFNAGIDTCWYNRDEREITNRRRKMVTYEIKKLGEVVDILNAPHNVKK